MGQLPRPVLFLAVIVVACATIWYSTRAPSPAQTPIAPNHQRSQNAPPSTSAPLSKPIEASTDTSSASTLTYDAASISGVVVLPDGAPVPGADVSAYEPDTGARESQSDSEGQFSIAALNIAKSYRVSATAPHYNDASIDNVPAGTRDVELVLHPLSSARGIVKDATSGAVLSKFEVTYLIVPPESDDDWQARCLGNTLSWQQFDDALGAFAISDITSNQPFAIGARAKGYSSAYVQCDSIAPGEFAEGITLELEPGAVIVGTVETSDSTAIPWAAIFAGANERTAVSTTRSDEKGNFEIAGLHATNLFVQALHPDYGKAETTVTIAAGGVSKVRLVFPLGGSLEGIVTNAGTPAVHAKLIVSMQEWIKIGTPHRETTSDTNGKFSVNNLPAGTYDIIGTLASNSAYTDSQQLTTAVEIEPGKITFVALAFRPATASITVNVTMNGAPVTDGEVRGVVGTDNGDKNFRASTNADGVYRAENLPAGAAYVEIIVGTLKRALTFNLRDGDDAQQTVDFDAQVGIIGNITTLAEGEHAEVVVVAGKVDADLSKAEELIAIRHMAAGVAEVNEDGAFRVEGLEPGDYTVIAVAFNPDDDAGNPLDTMRMAKKTVTLSNETVEIELAP